MRIGSLEIDDDILEKIEGRHGVNFYEVKEACLSGQRHVRRGRGGLYQVFGRSQAGRRLFAVIASRGGGAWQVATARDMTDRERRLYDRHTGG